MPRDDEVLREFEAAPEREREEALARVRLDPLVFVREREEALLRVLDDGLRDVLPAVTRERDFDEEPRLRAVPDAPVRDEAEERDFDDCFVPRFLEVPVLLVAI